MAPLKLKYQILDLNDIFEPQVLSNLFDTYDEAVDAIWENFGINPLRYQVITNYDVRKYGLRVYKCYRLFIRKLKHEYPCHLTPGPRRHKYLKKHRQNRYINHSLLYIRYINSKAESLKLAAYRNPESYGICFFLKDEDPNIWYMRTHVHPIEMPSENILLCIRTVRVDFNDNTVREKLVYIKNYSEVIPLKTMVFYSRLNKIKKKVKDKSALIRMSLWEKS